MTKFFKKLKKRISGGGIPPELIAGESLEVIWEIKKEAFQKLSKELIERKNVTYQNSGHLIFFLKAEPYSADFMAYCMGFIFGMVQAHEEDEKVCYKALSLFAQGYQKTIENYINQLNLQHNPKSYYDIFMRELAEKKIFESENGSQGLSYGLSDGKSYGDYQLAINKDYSLINNIDIASKANLDNLRQLLHQWAIGCLLDEELIDAMREA